MEKIVEYLEDASSDREKKKSSTKDTKGHEAGLKTNFRELLINLWINALLETPIDASIEGISTEREGFTEENIYVFFVPLRGSMPCSKLP